MAWNRSRYGYRGFGFSFVPMLLDKKCRHSHEFIFAHIPDAILTLARTKNVGTRSVAAVFLADAVNDLIVLEYEAFELAFRLFPSLLPADHG